MKFIPLVLRVLLALPMVIFGFNKLYPFIPMPTLEEGSLSQIYMSAFAATYLMLLVGLTEVIGGVLLLSKRTSALGAIILMPVSVNILAHNTTIDGSGAAIGMGLFVFVLNLAILFFNKERLTQILGEKGAK